MTRGLPPTPPKGEGRKEDGTTQDVAPLYLATGVFRAAIGMAAAPQRGANPPFATEAGQGEALRARNRPSIIQLLPYHSFPSIPSFLSYYVCRC